MSKFGPFIEGLGVAPSGDVYAVNYGDATTPFKLGRVSPKQEFFFSDASIGHPNAIHFLSSNKALVADATGKRVLEIEFSDNQNNISVYCSHPDMLQPNDIAVTSTGILFASGMKFTGDTSDTDGDLWMCRKGNATRIATMGRTNGIALSPDEQYLYLSESKNIGWDPVLQRVWRYSVADLLNGNYKERKIWIDYGVLEPSATKYDIDGMGTDKDGNLYVTRMGQGQLQVFEPKNASLIKIIHINILYPSSIAFSGNTIFVVGRCSAYATYGTGVGCADSLELNVTPLP